MTIITQNGYISLPITVDPNQLLANALDAIAALIPGWVPREGHLEVAILEQVAQMVSESAAVAAQVPLAIFQYFGSLVGINPIAGTAATMPVTFTMVDNRGYTIPAGTVVAYQLSGNTSILFVVQSAVTIPSGSTSGTGTLICETVGTFANGLAAATLNMVDQLAFISSVASTAASSGGVDAETTTAYLNRLSNELQLIAPRPILPQDFAALALNVVGVFRALAINGLNPGRTDTGCGTTSGSPVVTDAAITVNDVGKPVSGTGIPASTYVGPSSIAGTSIRLSSSATSQVDVNATATGTVSVTLADLTGQQRCVTVCGVDSKGNALTSTIQNNLLSYLQGLREVNFLVFVIPPTQTGIDVTVSVAAQHGQNTATVQAAINTALQAFLNPANWGGGNQSPPVWNAGQTIVRYLDVANVVRSVAGIDHIVSLQIATHSGSLGTADVTLPGDAPLPTSGTLSVTVTAT